MLSDKRIWLELIKTHIVIEPYNPKQLGTNSYDVRLGPNYWKPNHNLTVVDFTDEELSKSFWLGPFKSDDLIQIRPGETILAHTQEVIGARHGFTTSMRARSSIGRSCLSVCKCAGVGDVGYIGKWTMEITNHSHATVQLHVGQRVAQILFFEVGQTYKEYEGKYGAWEDWTPYDMLPKMYKDKDLLDLIESKR